MSSTNTVTVNNGTLSISGVQTYSGTTTLNGGTLAINSATAIGNGTLTIKGGTLDNNKVLMIRDQIFETVWLSFSSESSEVKIT